MWTTRLDASVPVRTGDQIALMADLVNAHFFGPDTTESIPAVVVVTAS